MKRDAREIDESFKKRLKIAPIQVSFESMPNEIKEKILGYLVTAQGPTNRARLNLAAANVRNFTRVSRSFRPFASCQTTTNNLIAELAHRHAHGDTIEAAIALGTQGAGQSLSNLIPKTSQQYIYLRGIGEKLSAAAGEGKLNVINFLDNFVLQYGNPYSLANTVIERLGYTPLIKAALRGDEAMVNKLLTFGVNWDMGNIKNITPFMAAAQGGKACIASKVIDAFKADKGQEATIANLNCYWAAENDYTALMFAVANDHPAIVKILLDAGADPKVKGFDIDVSPLTLAKQSTSAHKNEIIKLLKVKRVY